MKEIKKIDVTIVALSNFINSPKLFKKNTVQNPCDLASVKKIYLKKILIQLGRTYQNSKLGTSKQNRIERRW